MKNVNIKMENYGLKLENSKSILTFCIVILIFAFYIFNFSEASAAILSKPSPNLGLVGYWSFNEGTSTVALDYSGNKNKGTLTNGPTWVDGKRGKALNFDGVNDYVDASNAASLRPPSAITICAWVLRRTDGSDRAGGAYQDIIVRSSTANSGNYVLEFNQNPPGLFFGAGGDINVIVAEDSVSNRLNEWHHFCVSYSNANGGNIYTNGVSVASVGGAGANLTTNVQTVFIGGRSGSSDIMDGLIDEVRVYNRALSAAEIQALYKSGAAKYTPPNNLGLVGYWSFNEGTSTVALDYSGNKNKGTLVNGPTWVDGKRGKALNFDGSNDYISLSSQSNTNAYTKSVWVFARDLTGAGNAADFIFANDSGVQWRSSASTQTWYTRGLNLNRDDLSLPALTANEWVHLVFTYDGIADVKRIYKNGVLGSSRSPTVHGAGSLALAGTSHFIGESNDGQPFTGLIDEVRIYNRALSAGEVAALYNVGAVKYAPPNNLGLVGYWSFNEGTTTTALDYSGNKNKGTLVNGPTWVDGKRGKALNFDGSNDYVDTGSGSTIANIFASGGTASAWIKPKTFGDVAARIIDKQQAGTNGWAFRLCDGDGCFTGVTGTLSLCYTFSGSTGCWRTPNNSIKLGQWQHVVLIYNRSSTANDPSFYINSISQSVTELSTPSGTVGSDSAQLLEIGDRTANDRSFDGLIDEVRIYNRALSADEVKKLYESR